MVIYRLVPIWRVRRHLQGSEILAGKGEETAGFHSRRGWAEPTSLVYVQGYRGHNESSSKRAVPAQTSSRARRCVIRAIELISDPGESDDNTDDDRNSASSSPRLRKARIRAQSRSESFRTAREDLSDSSGESDDVSTAQSSTSSDGEFLPDDEMPSILAEHARRFKRSAWPAAPGMTESEYPSAKAHQQASGTLVRIAVEPVSLDFGITSLAAVSIISSAANHSVSSG